MDRVSVPPLVVPPFIPRVVRILLVLVSIIGGLWCRQAEAADFSCAAGDIQCLIDAITASNQNREANTIRLAAGTYSLIAAYSGDSTGSTGLPVILGNVSVTGVTAETTIIERGNYRIDRSTNLFRIFTVALTGRLSLDRVTVRGGNPGDSNIAGAILSQGVLSITNSTITENSAGLAGAIQIPDGTLTMRDSRVTANGAGLGGDIVSIGNTLRVPGASGIASSEIARTTISNNGMQLGATIAIATAATASITAVTLVRNGSLGPGAGISAGGAVTISNSTIANNNTGGTGFFDRVAIVAGANSSIVNSTIVNNQEGIRGAVRLQNSIVANNGFGDCLGGAVMSLGHNLIGEPNQPERCALSPTDLTGDPGLGPFVEAAQPGGGYFPLRATSPAIDAGDPTACRATDQRRLARPIDGNSDGVRTCDIGAVEFYPVVNDRLQLDSVTGRYIALGSSVPVNPFAVGGEFRVNATFTDSSGQGICHLAFEVVTLQAASSPPVMLTADGNAIGGQGIVIPAPLAAGGPDLAAGAQEQYRFRIGVSAPEAITFFVNALGEPAITPCTP